MADIEIKRVPCIDVIDNGTPAGTRPAINLIAGTNVTLTISDDPANNRVNVTIDAASGGGSPAGSDTQIQYNNAGAFGASAKLTWTDGTTTMGLGDPSIGNANFITASGNAGNPIASGFNFTGGNGYDDGVGGAAQGGGVQFQGGAGVNAAFGGSVELYGGNNNDSGGNGGNIQVVAGNAALGTAGIVYIQGGNSDDGTPGDVTLYAGSANNEANGAGVFVYATDGVGTNKNGGSVTITLGVATGTGNPGNLVLVNIPTSNPGVTGAIWCDTGAGNVLKMS